MRTYPTRPAAYRLSRIDAVLRCGPPPTARSLGRLVDASPRTILRDIVYMRDMLGAPIEYDPVEHGFRYTEEGYELPAAKLTQGELVGILVASKVLAQYAGTPYEAELKRAFAKIEMLLPDGVSCSASELASATSFGITAPRPGDLARFSRLTDAVRDRRRLRITYESASRGRTSTRLVDPLHLTCRDGAWYLLAWCHQRREIRMFVPERIRNIEEVDAYFEPPASFDPARYMSGAFRAMRGGRPRRVKLEFTGLAARLVPERRWHATQKITTRPDGAVRLEMTVTGLEEVAGWVMSFGGECRVVGPDVLRKRVVEHLRRGLAAQGRACRSSTRVHPAGGSARA